MNFESPVRRRHIGEHTELYLRSLHADPFVQASVWRLYCFAPQTLDPTIYTTLVGTEAQDDE
jgi:hypothetical protein